MEYDFSLNEQQQLQAQFSSGHEAIGLWLQEEVGSHLAVIDALLEVMAQLEARELTHYSHKGRVFHLVLDRDQVNVEAYALEVDTYPSDDELDEPVRENTNFYDDELRAECGFNDFKGVLVAWREFLAM